MNRSELVKAISDHTEVSQTDVDAVIGGLMDVVGAVACTGKDKISITGYLSFEQNERSARTGRNPQTGETLQIPASKGIKVSAGSKLKNIAKGTDPAPKLG